MPTSIPEPGWATVGTSYRPATCTGVRALSAPGVVAREPGVGASSVGSPARNAPLTSLPTANTPVITPPSACGRYSEPLYDHGSPEASYWSGWAAQGPRAGAGLPPRP